MPLRKHSLAPQDAFRRSLAILAPLVLASPLLRAADLALVPRPAVQDMIRENGALSVPQGSRVKTLDLAPEGGFQEGRHYEFRIRYENGNFAFVTGRQYAYESKQRDGKIITSTAAEMMSFAPLADRKGKLWNAVRATETSPGVDRRSNTSTLVLNYLMPEQTFATMDNVARWQEKEAATLQRDLLKEDLRLGVEIGPSDVRFFINGVFMRRLPRSGPGLEDCVLRIQRGAVVGDRVKVAEMDPRYRMLDISERLNAAGFPGGGRLKGLAAGQPVTVSGVPFLLPDHPHYDHVDLSMSWMEAAMRCGYDATEVWARWRAATDKVPLRYQFRVPGDNYEALYVLAASDGRRESIPRFTAQFYLPRRGRPVNVASDDVPAFDATGEVQDAYPVTLSKGKQARLYLVKVKLEPGRFTKFSRSPYFDMELTKDVQTYRAYPDPLTHSIHGAGLPSSVRVFGITFGRSRLKTTFDPDQFANVWHEGQRVSYTVNLENITDQPAGAALAFRAVSYDGTDTYEDGAHVSVKPRASEAVRFGFQPKKFGQYRVALVREHDGEKQTFERTLAHLRKRQYGARPFGYQGMFFGCWHVGSVDTVRLAGMMGLDGFSGLNPDSDEALQLMKHYGMQDFNGARIIRIGGSLAGNRNEAEDTKILQEKMPPLVVKPGEINKPVYSAILCEPGGVGTGNAGFGEYYGEEPYHYTKLKEKEKARYEHYKYQFLTIRKVLKQLAPDTKVMLPNGSWCFTIPFLQDPDTRELMDGVKCDFQFYTRLPEQQMHQCSIHSLYYLQNAWKKYRPGEKPLLVFGEGPDISPVYPGASTEEVAAAHRVRSSIIMAGYGAHHQHAWATSIHQSGGDNHCTGGFVDNEVSLNPELSYSAFAAHTRHMRDALFESYTDPGSFSAYCANFRNHKTGELVRLIWSIRGKREFILDVPAGRLTVYDAMDNLVAPRQRGGKSVIEAGPMPLYVYGADASAKISLGAIDHGDSRPGQFVKKLGNAAELFAGQTDDADANYVEMMPEYIKRFHAVMEIGAATAEEAYGGKALAVKLPPQKTDRGLMPYYTCLKPAKPVPIGGKGSHILVWVKANSDWGRLVYVLRDAKGKLWYGVGLKGEWNADDMPGDSVFCFDGWRLLRYELPANAPWDRFRELGFTCWGSDGRQSVVELPLSLEKIFVERRLSVMYGNGQHKVDEKPVLLGDLYVEYAKESDMTDEVIRLSKISVPQFPVSALPNPIAELKRGASLPAGRITGVKDPDTWFDGTRGVFAFEMPEDAVGADIWLSLYPDGRGGLRLGKDLKASPAQVSGFLADTEFYAFLVYRNKEGQTSAPSEPLKFKMVDHFGHQ